MLHVSANTLRAWEERFGYPRPQRSPGKHRLYAYAEIDALREALHDGLCVSSAVSVARDALSTDVDTLVSALTAFRPDRADAVMEASLALRPIDRAVEEQLVIALEEVLRRKGRGSASWAFAMSWAHDWLRRARRVIAPAERCGAVLVGDACGSELDPNAAYLGALELLCERAGVRLLSLPVRALGALPEAVTATRPDCLVIAGGKASTDEVARWVYGVRSVTGARPVALFRAGAASPLRRGVVSLDDSPRGAQRELCSLVGAGDAARPHAV